ncbi:MAG: hypothetical protein ACTSWY_16085 [Promethearchaeota archaeon]
MNNYQNNPPDIHGIHNFRFKWKKMEEEGIIKSIFLKIEGNFPKYFFETYKDEDNKDKFHLNEIINVKILKKIGIYSRQFKVIGAKGRNVIIGNIQLKEFGISDKLIIQTSLPNWRTYLDITK